ncbi:hypothetical protein SSX86_000565 [Deinandra increscens subsp. villosa]|uniref:FLZ-type domain-containing protein n=1 Tax=Deinandra increscens subsp. villosa TaxID=3103831 RepID=A0AAP0DY49_9ASTR
MILGKRPRPPIKRTTSITEFTLDHLDLNQNTTAAAAPATGGVSPRIHRRNSADHMENPHFLTVCRFCNRRLIPARDIFMYRGDTAFCSFECRQEQMNQDEKKDKQPLIPTKQASVDSGCSSNASKVD